ncbi:MAG: tyrosine-type recombinase/integrase [Verrucomicrobiota bacterium]|jgi:integrase
MQAKAMPFNPATNKVSIKRQHSAPTYKKVLDQRKHAIRGLWERNGRYYAQITVEDPNSGVKQVKRVPLEGAASDAQAVAKYQDLLTQRRKGALPVLKRTPKFADYAAQYFDYYKKVKDAKRESTLYTERIAINHWEEHLGHVRLDRITRALVNGYIAKRQGAGVTGRTVNLEVICFRNVMKRAIDDGWITTLPTLNLRPLKWTARRRGLLAREDIEQLCEVAVNDKAFKNGVEFADYVKLMAACGARRNETLRLKWSDVDWERKQLTIGSDGMAKNRKARVVDFNAGLEAHLKDMLTRRAPDTQWLFPSSQRGERDVPARSYVESMRLVRAKAGVPKFGFHDLRHYFISHCVMSGIDFMTIARWAGHQDGGVLIGKVYGHLSNEHAQRQAQRVNFGPVVLEPVAADSRG